MKMDRIDDPKVTLKYLKKLMNRQDTPAEKITDKRLFLLLCQRYFEQSDRRYDELVEVPFPVCPENKSGQQHVPIHFQDSQRG